MTGTLFLVATPIGNLEDITLRALRVLRESECVLAEDTRRTRILLVHHKIETRLASLHAHTSELRVDTLADELASGKSYALVTDAGTPLVSDPGAELVRAAVARGVKVEAIPGASAVMAALCVAGVAADHFRFVGFLPRSGKRRREALRTIALERLTSVMFEAPPRLPETLRDLREACGAERRAAVCRELTKLHEEVTRGSLRELCERYSEAPRGELTLVIEGLRDDAAVDEEAVEVVAEVIDPIALMDARLASGLGAREVAKELAQVLGIDRREAYRRVNERRNRAGEPGEE
ncbi:MAG: rRNA small subunit methyltransferase [Myxococcaceae bacterium]|nr:rRNA small subunit methyltransferase [Myxococcaceae bacterium]